MVGTVSYPYAGTFDGQGHTITFTKDATEEIIAPFRYISGATIQNVKTTGTITTTSLKVGGIVGMAQGTSAILNCASSMNMSSSLSDGQDVTIGGILGMGDNGANTTIEKCVYDGSISVDRAASGIVGYFRAGSDASFTLRNLVFAGEITSTENSNICNIYRDGGATKTVENCYYVNKANGTATDGTQDLAKLRSGQLAYEFQGGNATQYWGQGNLNSSRSDEYPIFTSNASKKVYKDAGASRYANSGGMLPDPAINGNLAWKFYPTAEASCVYMLPAEKASSYTLYGTSDTYVLRVTSAGATTLVLPFDVADVATGIGAEVKAYTLTFDGSTVRAFLVTSIDADNPVLINAPEGDYTISSGKAHDYNFNYATEHTETTYGALTGVYNTSLPFSYVPEGAYVLQNGADGLGFYRVTAEDPIKITSFRAYLSAPSVDVKEFLSINFDEATAVNEVKNEEANSEKVIFNVAGQRMGKIQKGVNIVNGKKIMVK